MTQGHVDSGEQSVYLYDEPRPKLSFRSISRFSLWCGAAAASVAIGSQVGGPALANLLYGDASTATQVSSSLPTVAAQANHPHAALSSQTGTNQSGMSDNSSYTDVQVSQLTGGADSPVSQNQSIAIPNPVKAPTYGNVSSATPAGGKVATSGSGASFKVKDAYESETDDDD